MFRELVSRLLRSRRVAFAVSGNGMFSLASFLLSISVARSSSVEVFGAFSLALVAYHFASGFIASAFTDTALSRPRDTATFVRALRRASLLGIAIGVALLAWGLVGGNGFILLLGVAVHGILLMDFLRMFDSAAGSASRAMTATTVWASISMTVSVISLVAPLDPLVVFAAWAVTGAVCGYGTLLATGMPRLPGWERERTDSRAAVVFSADYLVGQGGVHLTSGLLGLLDDARVLGAVRGAGTLLGPMNLVATTASSLMLPYLARDQGNPNRQFRSAVAAVAVQVTALAPLLLLLQFIPDAVGEQLLGDTWQYAALAILPMSLDSIFSVASRVAISAHRVNFAGRRTLFLRIGLGLPRPLVVLFSAYTWGIEGAAWSMASLALINAMSWWLSYRDLSHRAAKQPLQERQRV